MNENTWSRGCRDISSAPAPTAFTFCVVNLWQYASASYGVVIFLLQQQHPTPYWNLLFDFSLFAMECPSETKTDIMVKTSLQSGNPQDINPKKIIFISSGKKSQTKSSLGKRRIVEMNSPDFAPLKGYLSSLYGFSENDPDCKIVCIIEPVSQSLLYTIYLSRKFIYIDVNSERGRLRGRQR